MRTLETCVWVVLRNQSLLSIHKESNLCCISRSMSGDKQPETSPDHVKPPSLVKRYIIDKMMFYMEGYERMVGKRYPKAFKVYTALKSGTLTLLSDLRTYYDVSTQLWAGKSLNEGSHRDLEIYRQVPRDFLLMTPMLVATLLPIVPYIFFPIAYMYPRYLLSPHYWSQELRTQVKSERHMKCVQHYPAILAYLHHTLPHILESRAKHQLTSILNTIDHSGHPTSEAILKAKPLFEEEPFHLDSLYIPHLRRLGKSLNLSVGRSSLTHDGLLLHYIDLAISREGAENLDEHSLNRACFWRGLNPIGLSRNHKLEYLRKWLHISENIDENSLSLLLHSHVLLTYNEPSNFTHIKERRQHKRLMHELGVEEDKPK